MGADSGSIDSGANCGEGAKSLWGDCLMPALNNSTSGILWSQAGYHLDRLAFCRITDALRLYSEGGEVKLKPSRRRCSERAAAMKSSVFFTVICLANVESPAMFIYIYRQNCSSIRTAEKSSFNCL